MIELKAQPRHIRGSKVKTLRNKGFLPCVVYGEGVSSEPIATSFIDFERVYKVAGESTIVGLNIEGKKYNVLIHDVAYDAMRGHPIHADFFAVRMDKLIRTMVLFVFINESNAVKHEGGTLVKVMHEVEVEALPNDLPHELYADLSLLSGFESKVLISDISVPTGVKIMAERDEIVVLVEAPRTEEVLAELEQGAGSGVVEVTTEQEEKRAAKEAVTEDNES